MAEENVQKKLDLTITTPRGVKFVEKADMIIMRTVAGDLGVLPNHAPLYTVLGDGVMRIQNDGVEKTLAVFGGTAEIRDNHVTVLTTIAQRPDEIDLERAEEDRREAQEALREASEEALSLRLQVMQTRALVRIRVGSEGYFDDYGSDDSNNDSDDNDRPDENPLGGRVPPGAGGTGGAGGMGGAPPPGGV